MKRRTIYLDFDGVLNTYKNWVCDDYLYTPQDNVEQFLKNLNKSYKIVIFTARNTVYVKTWLIKYNLWKYVKNVTNIKGPAFFYIDDRCIRFSGSYKELSKQLTDFNL